MNSLRFPDFWPTLFVQNSTRRLEKQLESPLARRPVLASVGAVTLASLRALAVSAPAVWLPVLPEA